MGRRRAQAPRYGRAGRIRARAEDRRLGDQPRLRGRPLRARRDARRRRPGRGRDAEPAHDQVDPAAYERRRAPARRGARRGVHAALGLSRDERAPRRGGQAAGAESAQRVRRLAPPEGLRDHGAAAAVAVGVRHRRPRGPRPGDALGHAAMASRARLPDESVRAARGVGRRGGRGMPRMGAAADRARLRDRRDRDQGRLAANSRRGSARCTSGRAGRARSSGRR